MSKSLLNLPLEILIQIISYFNQSTLISNISLNSVINSIIINELYNEVTFRDNLGPKLFIKANKVRKINSLILEFNSISRDFNLIYSLLKLTKGLKELELSRAVAFPPEALMLKELKDLKVLTMLSPILEEYSSPLLIFPFKLTSLHLNLPAFITTFQILIPTYHNLLSSLLVNNPSLENLIIRNHHPSILTVEPDNLFPQEVLNKAPINLHSLEIFASRIILLPFFSTCYKLKKLHLHFQTTSGEEEDSLIAAIPNSLEIFKYWTNLPLRLNYLIRVESILLNNSKAISELKILHIAGNEGSMKSSTMGLELFKICSERNIELKLRLGRSGGSEF